MKKILWFLSLLVALILCTAALAAPNDANIPLTGEGDSLFGRLFAADGDTMYAAVSNSLYCAKLGEGKMTLVAEKIPEKFDAQDDANGMIDTIPTCSVCWMRTASSTLSTATAIFASGSLKTAQPQRRGS